MPKAKQQFAAQTFTINHDWLEWSMEVEVQRDNPGTQKIIREMVEFWSGWQQKLKANDGDYLVTFLSQLARECLRIQIGDGLNTAGVIEHFNKQEGWYPLDGTQGIKITLAETYTFSDEEFSIEPDPAL